MKSWRNTTEPIRDQRTRSLSNVVEPSANASSRAPPIRLQYEGEGRVDPAFDPAQVMSSFSHKSGLMEVSMTRRVVPLALLLSLVFSLQGFAQTDPGLRGDGAGAGGPLASVANNNPANILSFFNSGQDAFAEVDSVSGTVAGEAGSGLGPRYNSRSCVACHSQPASGGSAPAVNPEVGDATADGARNTIPSFITASG